jgi:hypothetical protein
MAFTITKIDKDNPTGVVANAFTGSIKLDNAGIGSLTIVSPVAFRLGFLRIGPENQNFGFELQSLLNDVPVGDPGAVWGTQFIGTQASATLSYTYVPDEALLFRHALRLEFTSAAGAERTWYYQIYAEERSN